VYGWWCKGPWKKTKCSVFVTVSAAAAAGSAKSSAAATVNLGRNDERGADTQSVIRAENYSQPATPKVVNQARKKQF